MCVYIYKHITVYNILYMCFFSLAQPINVSSSPRESSIPRKGLKHCCVPLILSVLASLRFVVNGGCADQKYVIIIIYIYIWLVVSDILYFP